MGFARKAGDSWVDSADHNPAEEVFDPLALPQAGIWRFPEWVDEPKHSEGAIYLYMCQTEAQQQSSAQAHEQCESLQGPACSLRAKNRLLHL